MKPVQTAPGFIPSLPCTQHGLINVVAFLSPARAVSPLFFRQHSPYAVLWIMTLMYMLNNEYSASKLICIMDNVYAKQARSLAHFGRVEHCSSTCHRDTKSFFMCVCGHVCHSDARRDTCGRPTCVLHCAHVSALERPRSHAQFQLQRRSSWRVLNV